MKISMATIEHKHGVDVRIALTKKGMREKVYQYVKENWNTEVGNSETIPEDHEKAIDKYFEIITEETLEESHDMEVTD